MDKKFVLGVMVLLGGAAAYQSLNPKGPVDFYLEYQTLVAEGRTFDQDAAFYAASRRAEVQAQIDARGEDGNLLKNAYLDMTNEQAGCSELTLAEESVADGVTRLVFDVKDTCGTYDEGTKVQEIIELVEEDGWKILSNTTSVSD